MFQIRMIRGSHVARELRLRPPDASATGPATIVSVGILTNPIQRKGGSGEPMSRSRSGSLYASDFPPSTLAVGSWRVQLGTAESSTAMPRLHSCAGARSGKIHRRSRIWISLTFRLTRSRASLSRILSALCREALSAEYKRDLGKSAFTTRSKRLMPMRFL